MTTPTNPHSPEQLFERKFLDLEVLTPIHIGSREGSLRASEFLVDNGKVHMINEEKFSRWLQNHNLIDAFVEEAKTGRLNLKEFAQKQKGWRNELGRWTIRTIPVRGGQERIREFRPMIRDAHGQVFLPGSAIKGVFRTAVLTQLVKQSPVLQAKIAREAQNSENLWGKKKSFFSAQWLQNEYLQNFPLSGTKRKPGPNEDILRCLHVRDAYPVGPIETQVLKLGFLSKQPTGAMYWSKQKFPNGQPRDYPLEVWVEAVTTGRFRLEFLWDNQLFNKFQAMQTANRNPPLGIMDLQDILRIMETMNQELATYEHTHYHPQAKGTTPNQRGPDPTRIASALSEWYANIPAGCFRVGFGGGMLSTTVGLHIEETARQSLRDACAPKYGKRPGHLAPKSRRVWVGPNGQALPMGWGKLVAPKEEAESQPSESARNKLDPHPHTSRTHLPPDEQRTQRLQAEIKSVMLQLKRFKGAQDKSRLGGILATFDQLGVTSEERAEIVEQLLEPLSTEWKKSWLGKALREWQAQVHPGRPS